MTPPSAISHLSYYPSSSCHLLACQFERQWLPQARLFLDPVEQALAFLPLWHLPPSHLLFLPEISQERFDSWVAKSNPPQLERSCHRLPTDRPIQLFGISPLALSFIHENQAQAGSHASAELIQTLHDKRFIEQVKEPLDPYLPSGWMNSIGELAAWIQKYPQQRWMVKRPWASAGLGNLPIEPYKPLPRATLERWLAFDGGWIVQPFVERLIDFSSLWWLEKKGTAHLFSLTRMEIGPKGRYLGCRLAKPSTLFQDDLPLIEAHLEQARSLFKNSPIQNYSGPLGIDGMIYRDTRGLKRQTIIEINVRQTLAMHLVSCARALYPHFEKNSQLLARLIPSGSERKEDRLLLPSLPRAFNLAIHQVS